MRDSPRYETSTLWVPSSSENVLIADDRTTNILRVNDEFSILVPLVGGCENESDRNRIDAYFRSDISISTLYLRLVRDELPSLTVTNNNSIPFAHESFGNSCRLSIRTGLPVDENTNTIEHGHCERRTRPIRRNNHRSNIVPCSSETPNQERTEWHRVVTALITLLESSPRAFDDEARDIAVAKRMGKVQGSLSLVRCDFLHDFFQLCFAFGFKKWRRRRSMYAVLVRITIRSSDVDDISVTCSCHKFRLSECCEHFEAVYRNEENKMRIRSLAARSTSSSRSICDENKWDALQIPCVDGDDVEVWHVFLRKALSSQFRTSSIVLLDMRKQVVWKTPKSRVQCMTCPGLARNRMLCVHETIAAELVRERNNEGENATDVIEQEVDVDIALDELDRQMNFDSSSDELQRDEIVDYTSTKPRSFFPCSSDERALLDLIRTLFTRSGEDDVNEEGFVYFVGRDPIQTCKNCGECVTNDTECERITRRASLHTLHHGCIPIAVIDSRCPKCHRLIPYDGAFDALFCTRKDHVFTRELLDAWLWDVCGTGGTFRDAFYSWETKTSMASASLHRVTTKYSFARQRGNEAFSAFLTTLQFPQDDHVFALFSCKKCERTLSTGEKCMDAVVMDGSAVGILGRLPEFKRLTSVVKSVPRVSDRQYVMATPKSRMFVDSVLVSAKRAGVDGKFDVPLKQSLWEKRIELLNRFFVPGVGQIHESRFVSEFIRAAFENQSYEIPETAALNDPESDAEGNTSNEVSAMVFVGKIRIKFKEENIDLRRTIIDFGRCFCVGSIAGGALRDENSISHAINVERALREFSLCVHNVEGAATNVLPETVPVCMNCAYQLNEAGLRADEKVSSVARFSCAIADCASFGSGNNLRKLAASAADVVNEAMIARANYFKAFENNKGYDVVSYEENHMRGDGAQETNLTRWFYEACETGELFPGRPQVRPNMDFGPTSSAENSRSCRKHYSKARAHTPGIFTVQCACKRPKLLGVSVMTRTEGVSTALSVLLSRFKILPRVCYYDNGCNMARSIVLRVPWVNNECLLVCDRFHYASHTCNSICDPDSYTSCTDHATSSAESINQLWTFSKSHLRFLGPENLMPFLTARSIFMNVRAYVREETGKSDITTKMLLKFFREKWNCTCARCVIENN